MKKQFHYFLYLPLIVISLASFSQASMAGEKQAMDHAVVSERLNKIMRQLFSVVHEEELAGETQITREQLTDLIESVEELMFFAEVMSTKIPVTEMEETDAVIFGALADRLYDEALSIQQLATNYDSRTIDSAQQRLFNDAYLGLNRTCNACHQTFRD